MKRLSFAKLACIGVLFCGAASYVACANAYYDSQLRRKQRVGSCNPGAGSQWKLLRDDVDWGDWLPITVRCRLWHSLRNHTQGSQYHLQILLSSELRGRCATESAVPKPHRTLLRHHVRRRELLRPLWCSRTRLWHYV